MQRPEDGSDVTGFGSFDNSTCKRVVDLLEPGDLKLGQVVIKRVAVVELGVNNGSGDGGSCFGIEWVVVSGELLILAIFLLRPMSRNSVLEELSVRRFAVIQEQIRSRAL